MRARIQTTIRAMGFTGLLLGLQGCDVYNDDFDCPPPKGLVCKSLSEVYGAVLPVEGEGHEDIVWTAGAGGEEGRGMVGRKKGEASPLNLVPVGKAVSETRTGRLGALKRWPEQVVKVWVPGKATTQDDFVEGHYVYVPVKKKGWALQSSGFIERPHRSLSDTGKTSSGGE